MTIDLLLLLLLLLLLDPEEEGTALVRFFPAASSKSSSSSASTSVNALLLVLAFAASRSGNRVKQCTISLLIKFLAAIFGFIFAGFNATLQLGHCFFVFIDSCRQLRQKTCPLLHCTGSANAAAH